MKWIFLPLALSFAAAVCNGTDANDHEAGNAADSTGQQANAMQDSALKADSIVADNQAAPIDTSAYNKKMRWMANGDSSGRWPAKGPYPLKGALLPFNRIIAYYGNLYSTRMGILGELPKKQMLEKLRGELGKWEKADPETPAIPALHYIAVTAQGEPGSDGKYRLRMPFKQIDTIVSWAKEIKALTFIDVQVGLSSLQEELPRFEKYFKLPGFHLGIDPEFSMKGGQKPGSVIGSFNADDINYAIDLLAKIVRDNKLPPKILVVHRFTSDMVANYKNIKKVPEVQVVIDMDGWGGKELKAGTWKRFVYEQPVQFAGFKIFYKNDLKNGSKGIYTPSELVKFKPIPLYIQYQ
ncbi:hypothetical protein U0035_16955 [Niabella yanshanensis]|uniref:Lipoprotein n=1 Tax=Niabella yanshanensis TaxID=577386 RepID=A0ABZ0W352_9BACT|nr:hypothetical protein [Niabella yanshanensis]WQD37359.1 hypothetical protein U0035_16955 [Niabella yanshanensis]